MKLFILKTYKCTCFLFNNHIHKRNIRIGYIAGKLLYLCMKIMNRKRKGAILFSVILFTACLLVGIVILACNIRIVNYAKGAVYDDTRLLPENKVGLLLGTSPMLENGRNNLYFDYRIEAAAELYKSGKIKYILVSGDNRRLDYNEPEEMRKSLLMLQIPDSVIVLDYAGLRTLDSVVRAKKIFGQDRFTVISQHFHNERALFIAGKHGIKAVGFNAHDVNSYAGVKTRIRELLARVKVFIDLAIEKQPRHLGPPVSIP